MTHTLLLTDLAQVVTDDVRAAHDRLARDLLPAHGGREYDHTDGFLLLFDRAADAAAYAAA